MRPAGAAASSMGRVPGVAAHPEEASRRTSAGTAPATMPGARSSSQRVPIRTRTRPPHGRPDGGEHAPELAPPALRDRDAVPGQRLGSCSRGAASLAVSGSGRRAQVAEPCQALVEGDAVRRVPAPGRARAAAPADGVLALELVARMEHPLRPVAVVGEQQEALRVTVEAAHRVDAARPRRRTSAGTSSITVRVAWRSRTVLVTPTGLLSAR